MGIKNIVQLAREVSGRFGEETIANIFQAEKRGVQRGADLQLNEQTNIEVKCRFYGQPINILVDQLLELDDRDIYALLFYRLPNGWRPAYALSQKQIWEDSYEYFSKIAIVSKIFLFESVLLKDFYQQTHMKESTISSSGKKHKGLSVQSAQQIFIETSEKKVKKDIRCQQHLNIKAETYIVGKKIENILMERGY